MKKISTRDVTYRFAGDLAPVLTVEPGEVLELDTLDSWSGRLRKPEDIHTVKLDPELANPATGPVAVRGAEPGDTLIAEIRSISLHSPGLSKIVGSGGILGSEVHSPYLRLVDVESESVVLRGWSPGREMRLRVRPMIGVIGVAPAKGALPTLYPGNHGGNLDINEIRTGSRVYLPVSVPGALFALGDVHATMGDGELSGAGIDICSTVVVGLDLEKSRKLIRPFVETPEFWTTCAAAPTVSEAVKLAARDMVSFLSSKLDISREDAFLVVSACGDARIGQACGSEMPETAYLRVPRAGLEREGQR